eukprot:m.48501 g.48501  ORF g.48501 m.48501 type:complete len:185 (+) comp17800_c0_seq1:24-578(+)
MCIFCSGDPVDDDPRAGFQKEWETGMLKACCNHPLGCLIALCCPPCFACYLRYKALQGDMDKYKCCQGYICGKCMKCTDGCAHACPWPCLCLEAFCCESCAISATRLFIQDERQIKTDPCDNRIIRCNNCLQILSCICNILAIIFSELQTLAAIIDLIADIVYCIVQACMQAQTHKELLEHPTP